MPSLHLQSAVRRATAADRPALERLEQAAFRTDRLSARSWRELLRSESATVLAAANGDVLCGAAVLLQRARSSVARVYSIAVDPAARGQGVGAALLRACIACARDRGCSVLRLETRADNRLAQALFRRLGFVEFERKPCYYADRATAWRYQLEFSCDPCASGRR